MALKQKDNIKALDFYVLEMDKYFLELEFFSKNFFDKIILFFEKHLN
jgi:hypothetical protein